MAPPSFMSNLANPYAPYKGFQNPTTKKGLAYDIGDVLNTNKALEGQQQGQRNAESSTLFPQYQDMLNSGYSGQEKSRIVGGALSPIAGAYAGAEGQAANRVARTGNSAGYGSFLGELARHKGQDISSASQNAQVGFADEKQRRREAGMAGIAQLYGIDTSFLNELGGQQLSALGVGNSVEARRKGIIGNLQAGVNLAKSVVGSGASGGLFA